MMDPSETTNNGGFSIGSLMSMNPFESFTLNLTQPTLNRSTSNTCETEEHCATQGPLPLQRSDSSWPTTFYNDEYSPSHVYAPQNDNTSKLFPVSSPAILLFSCSFWTFARVSAVFQERITIREKVNGMIMSFCPGGKGF